MCLNVIPEEVTATLPEGLKGLVVAEVVRAGGRQGFLSKTGHVFRRSTGAVKAWVPLSLKKFAAEWGLESKPKAYLESVDPADIPPDWVWVLLYEVLLKAYDREVLVWHAVSKEGEWAVGIPEQTASPAYVEIKDGDDVATTLVEAGFRVTGTTHIHPGSWVGFSGTDKTTFVDNPGVHGIISRDGTKVGIHVSVHGALWTVTAGDELNRELPEGGGLRVFRSGDRPLEELLKVPAPRIITTYGGCGPYGTYGNYRSGSPYKGDYTPQIHGFQPQDRRPLDLSEWDQSGLMDAAEMDKMVWDEDLNKWVTKGQWLAKELAKRGRTIRGNPPEDPKDLLVPLKDLVVVWDNDDGELKVTTQEVAWRQNLTILKLATDDVCVLLDEYEQDALDGLEEDMREMANDDSPTLRLAKDDDEDELKGGCLFE